MDQTLDVAAAMDGYTLSDRRTWLSFKDKRSLMVIVEGDRRLCDQYGIILVNLEKHPQVNQDLGRKLISWLTSENAERAMDNFRINGAQLFFPASNGLSMMSVDTQQRWRSEVINRKIPLVSESEP